MKAVFGAGCFWHVQEKFDKLDVETEVGYMGGNEKDHPSPTYKQVCSDKTGYAEVIKIEYDEYEIDYDKLLNLFWKIHNPTQLNQQGLDIGSQYRSVIFYFNEEQKQKAEKSKQEIQKKYKEKIQTQIINGNNFTFFKAEDYHQKYNKNNFSSCKL